MNLCIFLSKFDIRHVSKGFIVCKIWNKQDIGIFLKKKTGGRVDLGPELGEMGRGELGRIWGRCWARGGPAGGAAHRGESGLVQSIWPGGAHARGLELGSLRLGTWAAAGLAAWSRCWPARAGKGAGRLAAGPRGGGAWLAPADRMLAAIGFSRERRGRRRGVVRGRWTWATRAWGEAMRRLVVA